MEPRVGEQAQACLGRQPEVRGGVEHTASVLAKLVVAPDVEIRIAGGNRHRALHAPYAADVPHDVERVEQLHRVVGCAPEHDDPRRHRRDLNAGSGQPRILGEPLPDVMLDLGVRLLHRFGVLGRHDLKQIAQLVNA